MQDEADGGASAGLVQQQTRTPQEAAQQSAAECVQLDDAAECVPHPPPVSRTRPYCQLQLTGWVIIMFFNNLVWNCVA